MNRTKETNFRMTGSVFERILNGFRMDATWPEAIISVGVNAWPEGRLIAVECDSPEVSKVQAPSVLYRR